jgi:hypothetical protein
MHRTIAERSLGRTLARWEHVDHVRPGDTSGLDNTRANLRLASPKQNARHCRTRTHMSGAPVTSKWKGVSWHKASRKWVTQILVNGQKMYLGLWRCEKLAALMYDDAARKYHGEFARLNFPGPEESQA